LAGIKKVCDVALSTYRLKNLRKRNVHGNQINKGITTTNIFDKIVLAEHKTITAPIKKTGKPITIKK
jgi:hypothetical protein